MSRRGCGFPERSKRGCGLSRRGCGLSRRRRGLSRRGRGFPKRSKRGWCGLSRRSNFLALLLRQAFVLAPLLLLQLQVAELTLGRLRLR